MTVERGDFTLPGEAGYEKLTLELAGKWGADVIRDSDGTRLSDDLLTSGYGIYSTVCVIRDHNPWIRAHPGMQQQCFLMTEPVVAVEPSLSIELMKDFFSEQFRVNSGKEALEYWEVWDRTENQKLSVDSWEYIPDDGTVRLYNISLWHAYSVSFLAYRIWEEISMYNHLTNGWDKEHIMQLDPRYPQAQEYLLRWMEDWCIGHPDTTVVRFTSLFYNFVWIWGNKRQTRYSDWASYDFTVSPLALKEFERKYGYSMTAEDFINGGKFHVTHMPADSKKLDWMKYTHQFVLGFGKKLVDVVHRYGKKAYVFYDDSWVGLEPYADDFEEFGFDGIIKCVFSGFEARLCAGVQTDVHEIRLHPYLFPVGLGGAPTFSKGGNPTLDAKRYWAAVRRAVLREPVDRIGLGGYLHLAGEDQEFCDYMELLSDEFRRIKALHRKGKPYSLGIRVGILTFWGRLRSWTLSGHFHETWMHDLIHIYESLSGLPVDVDFLAFEDVKNGKTETFDVIINAGGAKSAWSGGEIWADSEIVEKLTKWVYDGGVLIGVKEPSYVTGFDTCFRMSHVLGVDQDCGERVCHGKPEFDVCSLPGIGLEECHFKSQEGIYLTDEKSYVLMEEEGIPVLTVHEFGKGRGIYLSSFTCIPAHTRLLFQLLWMGRSETVSTEYLTDNPMVDSAWFPESGTLVLINSSDQVQKVSVETPEGRIPARLEAFEAEFISRS